VEATVQALLVAVINDPTEKVRPCDLQKLINSLQLKKACGIDGVEVFLITTLLIQVIQLLTCFIRNDSVLYPKRRGLVQQALPS
jgi:hypothetical protein